MCNIIIQETMMSVNAIMESAFNITYLIVVYTMVIIMAARLKKGITSERKTAGLFIAAFLLLALGDTGHVGFRVVAYLNGGIEANKALTGAGSMSTAFTVTVFYMLMMEFLYRLKINNRGILYWTVMVTGVIRLVFMLLPGNNWGGSAPLLWSYSRNAMLTVMGIIIAVMFLTEGRNSDNRMLKLISLFIFISFGFYLPVILFVHLVPELGMLMIPKTCAYVAIAGIGLKFLFKKEVVKI